MTDKPKKEYFQKIPNELLNNQNLNSHEKLIYIICKSFENAPKGCVISNEYLRKRTGIKDPRVIRKYLDRLTLFGYLARKQINQGTNHVVFDKPTMQEYIKHHFNKRNKMKRSQHKRLKTPIKKGDIINIQDYLIANKLKD